LLPPALELWGLKALGKGLHSPPNALLNKRLAKEWIPVFVRSMYSLKVLGPGARPQSGLSKAQAFS
jgi:hypothetical protein